jgi:hypothetical protein
MIPRPNAKPDAEEARVILELWYGPARADTYAIACVVGRHQSDVCRIIQASRDVARELPVEEVRS